MNGFGLYQEIRKLDDKVKICFLTAATDVYYEAFGKEAFPNFDQNRIIRIPIENELVDKTNKVNHVGLYQKFGFWPRFLTVIMTNSSGLVCTTHGFI
jgi:hypothetical protein